MNIFRMLGILFACGLIIKFLGDKALPRLLTQTAKTVGSYTKVTRDLFGRF